jgi:hypothetical protein
MLAIDRKILEWLLEGDVSIQYQVRRDLMGEKRPDLRDRIAREGWGAAILERRRPDGHWGRGFYQPKWTSTHYTLLDLKTLQAPPDHPQIRESVDLVVRNHKAVDGGINPGKTIQESDVCVNGMFMNYACYFGVAEESIRSVVDFILEQPMADGGFNCRKNRGGARHGSMHSTLSLLEGMFEYRRRGYRYRLQEMDAAAGRAREFLLRHRLFLSDRTGEIIRGDFLRLSFPGRWRYDILRALDHFQDAGIGWDERLGPALDVLGRKRRSDGRWPLGGRIPGANHFDMERPGRPSRWNTLRALRVLKRHPPRY